MWQELPWLWALRVVPVTYVMTSTLSVSAAYVPADLCSTKTPTSAVSIYTNLDMFRLLAAMDKIFKNQFW